MSIKVLSKQCACLPTWLRAPDDECKTCTFCTEPFADEACFVRYWMYSCCSNKSRAHVIGIALHEQCTQPYQEHMENMDYLRFVEPCPISPEHLPKEYVEKMLAECREKHKPLGSWCANCNVAHQEGTKFFRCTACHCVHYCSQACQRRDWPLHKEFCRAKCTSDPEVGLPDTNSRKACPCLTKKERIYHDREGTGLCSNPSCDKCVFPPYTLNFCLTECTRAKGKFHFIQTQFCTVDCQEEGI